MNTRLGHIAIACGIVAILLLACGGTDGAVGDGGGPPPEGPDAGVISEAGADAASADATNADATNADGALQGDGSPPDAAPKDDPCPAKLDVNCSTSCSGPSNCSQVACNLPVTAGYVVPDGDFPFVLRTASSPVALTPGGVPPQCTNNCGGSLVWYGLHFRIVTSTQPKVRVRVEPPWLLSSATSTADDAACMYRVRCLSLPVGSPPIVRLVVATTDPNAPARNVVVEATSDPCVP